jgi:cytochrome P450
MADDLTSVFDPKWIFDFPDPYPLFAGLRQTTPVTNFKLAHRESYIVTRYDDVRAVLHDGETYSSRANAEVGKFMGRTLIEMDGKEHTRTRALVQRAFAARAVDGLAGTMTALVNELIDGFAREGRADLVEQFTLLFPVQVIAEIIGIPRTDYPQFQRWSLDLIAFSKDPERGRAASDTLREYFLPVVRRRRAEPRDDVISRLVTGTIDGVGLTDEEVVSFLRLLLPAGAETTSRLIGSMLFALIAEPERFARVHAERALVPWAIEETLRWETPVLFVARETTKPVEIAGVPIPAGMMLSAVIGSANRDESHFPDPDRFDLDRRTEDHLSFAFGRHFCLGHHLAKLEARTALGALLDRLRNPRFDPDAPPPSIRGLAFRSPQSLPVRFDV